jgi:hypothetical protein
VDPECRLPHGQDVGMLIKEGKDIKKVVEDLSRYIRN